MPTAKPWMKFFVGDYIADTPHLTCMEHGGYLLLIMHAWTHDGALPSDHNVLRKIIKMPPAAWAQSKDTILGFFYLDGDVYRHRRVDKELSQADQIKVERATSGPKNGEKPTETVRKTEEKSPAGAPAKNQTQTHKEEPSLRSGADSADGLDIRTALWRDGWPIINKLTGMGEQKTRAFLAALLKIMNDDCQQLYSILRTAESLNPMDAKSWLMAACQQRVGARGVKPTMADGISQLHEKLTGSKIRQPGFKEIDGADWSETGA